MCIHILEAGRELLHVLVVEVEWSLQQVFSKCAQIRDTVGLANCGISSAVAKDMHKKQGIYGTQAMA